MPLFHFVIDKNGLNEGNEVIAIELVHFDKAWEETTRFAGEVVRDLDGKLHVGAVWRFQVQDEEGRPIRTILVTAT